MKRKNILLSIFAFTFIQCTTIPKNHNMDEDFKNPPETVQTGVYWYWIEGNITKEGVIKDLEAMKAAGINRAFIANIGGKGTGDPNAIHKVEFMSDEWWNITHAALKKATELNIEIGLFNSPGWSQSGGPWIKSTQTMRYLASSQKNVKGPGQISVKIPKPTEEFEDVVVLAFPNQQTDKNVLNVNNSNFSIQPNVDDIEKITDNDINTGITFSKEGRAEILIEANKEFTARSIIIRPTPSPIHTHVELQAKNDNGIFSTISNFEINRVRDWKKVGFDPYADVAISFEPITSTEFKLIFDNVNTNNGIAELVLSSTPRIERYKEKSLAKLFQTEVPSWSEYLWRVQPENNDTTLAIKESQIINLTNNLNEDGTINWDVPEGEWTVLRMGMSPTGVVNEPACPDATGYEVDKMSKKHVESHFNDYIGEILRRIPANDRKTFRVLVQDSYEVGGQNFTDDMIPLFKKRYGYDPTPYLPVLNGFVIGSKRKSDAFLWDLRRFIADKISYDYVGGTREIAHKHGLTTWLENYGHWGFCGEFLQYGGQADEVGGEFWCDPPYGEIENKLATSCSHIYGKKLTSSESSTSAGPAYLRTPNDLKQRMDRYFTYGINNTVLHLYISQPDEQRLPGSNAWFGTEFDRNNIWFKYMDLYTKYIKRCNYMMRQGCYQADVAYFIGEDTPKMVGIMEPWIPAGYQFEHINAEVIINNLEVKDGRLILPNGISFKVLVLPRDLKTMRPELLEKIEKLIWNGAIVMGPAPVCSPSLENQPEADNKIKELSSKIWGEIDGVSVKQRTYGKGLICNGLSFEELFNQLNYVPDCKILDGSNVYQGHQKDGDTDIYILSNQENHEINTNVAFRLTGKQPELWEPLTGEIRNLPSYVYENNTTIVPIKLEKGECVFVLFRNKGKSTYLNMDCNYPKPKGIQSIKNNWNVTFDGAFDTPAAIQMDTLVDLSTHQNDSVKYFSGTITYSTKVNINKAESGDRLYLRFKQIGSMAKIYINDQYAGGVWTNPYKLDVTNFLKDGVNDIKIKVVNTWVNRLIGDLNLPENKRKTYCFINPYKANSPLPPSGIVGDVWIENIAVNCN